LAKLKIKKSFSSLKKKNAELSKNRADSSGKIKRTVTKKYEKDDYRLTSVLCCEKK
jgi:hypothetical protein